MWLAFGSPKFVQIRVFASIFSSSLVQNRGEASILRSLLRAQSKIHPKSSKTFPKPFQNPPQDPPKTASKYHFILQTPKLKNNTTLPRFCSFLTFPGLPKSIRNRRQNAFKNGFILETLLEPQKIRFSKLKSSQEGPNKFPKFSKIRHDRPSQAY